MCHSVPGWTDGQHNPAQCLQVPQNISSSIFMAHRQRQQFGKAVCSLENLPFPPEFGRGTGLIQLNFHQKNCLKLQEKQQEGHRANTGEKEGGMLYTAQSITATGTYCTPAINPSPVGHCWRQKSPQQPLKSLAKEHSSAVSLQCQPDLGTVQGPWRNLGLVPQGVLRAGEGLAGFLVEKGQVPPLPSFPQHGSQDGSRAMKRPRAESTRAVRGPFQLQGPSPAMLCCWSPLHPQPEGRGTRHSRGHS